MGLFQKKPKVSNSAPLYTLGTTKTVLIVGLGNPGKQYDKTRHNIGFMCLDEFAKASDFEPWADKKDLKSHVATHTLGDTRVILVKPTTFMNLSGEAIQAVSNFYKIPASQTLAVYDELDVAFGQIRARMGGGSAGHNGVKSLIEHIGEGFGRIRIGTGNPEAQGQMDSADFVLAKFSKEEQKHLPALTKEVTSLLTEYVYGGSINPETRSFIA